jgi:hypothetical protein
VQRAESAQPKLPLRAAFYYPWYPQTWTVGGKHPHYRPSLGYYDSSSAAVIRTHIRGMRWGRVQAGISSWWGTGDRTDARFARLLQVTRSLRSPFRWAIFYEPEGQGDPTPAQLRADLSYIHDRYGNDPAYLRLNGRFVVFVWSDGGDACGMADRWRQANTVGAYVVLKVFPGYRRCASQPDGWDQYAPVSATSSQLPFSYTISPGFWKANEDSAQLARNLARWRANVRSMVASHARIQLVTTFNEWGEGTEVESAKEWASASGFGAYLDALHTNGRRQLPAARHRKKRAPKPKPRPPSGKGTAVLLAAGDIASCSSRGDEATAKLVAHLKGTVALLGDIAYENGSTADFGCYDASWGRFKPRTRPAVGNHEYLTAGAAPYFAYFGAAAGNPAKGYYSYKLGAWHVVVLNSNCGNAGGCDAGSPQDRWLRRDLVRHRTRCTLAYWHHALFSSGQHGSNTYMRRIWGDLYRAGADVVLNGHDHDYERFAPQTPSGTLDPRRGIREFVVGTGGKNHYSIGPPIANARMQNDTAFGILKLTLRPTSYSWHFIPEFGKTFSDSGSTGCH